MIEIKDKSLCAGCHACYNKCPKNAIEMVEDDKGFLYPHIDKNKCIDCGLCNRVCPIVNKKNINNDIRVYACYNKDEEIRMQSSSGGIFTLLATQILNQGGIVCGATFNEDFSVSHQWIENIEDLDKLRTSKYVQSIIANTYKEAKSYLESNRYVLYTGTPCQIEGLLMFLGKKYDKLYTQDIVCHGVPSPSVWKKYLEYRKEKDKQQQYPKQINFRDKRKFGWHHYSLSLVYGDFRYSKKHGKDLFMKSFLRDLCLRDSCYNCAFKKEHRLSDITLADCWGIKNINSELDDNRGTSLILVNSDKGIELYNKIKNQIETYETTIEKAIANNPAIIKSPSKNINSDEFFKNINNEEFGNLVNRYAPDTHFVKKILRKIKRKLLK